MLMLVALFGPLLVAFMVNVTVSPTLGVVLFTVCLTCASAAGFTVISQLAELSAGVGSVSNAFTFALL